MSEFLNKAVRANFGDAVPVTEDGYVLNFVDGVSERQKPGDTGLNVVCMADVKPERVEWFWPGRFPLGKLSLMVGQPGVGKSFVTTDMAARCTNGNNWPDGKPNEYPGEAVFLCGEDGLADTVRIRLDTANAEVSKVFVIDSRFTIDDEGHKVERAVRLDSDIDEMDKFLTNRDGRVRLMVIDPISEFEGNTDSHKNSDVRSMLKPLARLAEKHRVAVVMVSHMRKGGSAGGPAMYAAMGSLAYSAAARTAWAFIPDTQTEGQVLILPLKNNLHKKVPGLAYHIEDMGNNRGFVSWSADEIEISAEDAMARLAEKPKTGSALDKCIAWLQQRLANGPHDTVAVEADSDSAGFSTSCLKRARRILKVRATKNEGTGNWTMSLPDDETSGILPSGSTRGSNSRALNLEPLEPLVGKTPSEVVQEVQQSQGVQEDQEVQNTPTDPFDDVSIGGGF